MTWWLKTKSTVKFMFEFCQNFIIFGFSTIGNLTIPKFQNSKTILKIFENFDEKGPPLTNFFLEIFKMVFEF